MCPSGDQLGDSSRTTAPTPDCVHNHQAPPTAPTNAMAKPRPRMTRSNVGRVAPRWSTRRRC